MSVLACGYTYIHTLHTHTRIYPKPSKLVGDGRPLGVHILCRASCIYVCGLDVAATLEGRADVECS